MRKFPFVGALVVAVAMPAYAAASDTHRDEEVTLSSGAISLACTLAIPPGRGPFPAAVLLSGSGPQNRDSELVGFRPFKLLAEHLAQQGTAVLRCDDRGVGGSTGSVPGATTADFADDALAAVRALGERSDILKNRIGLIGHSEGAIAGAIAASRSPEVAFLVWMAGSAVSGAEILRMQAATLARAGGASEDVVDEIVRRHTALMSAIKEGASGETLLAVGRPLVAAQAAAMPEAQRKALGDIDAWSERLLKQTLTMLESPWMRAFVNFDPSVALRQVSCPVLAVFGGRDLQVPEAANRSRLETALTAAGNRDVTVKVYGEANHLFMQAVTGHPAEYGTLPKAFVASLLEDVTAWIASRPD